MASAETQTRRGAAPFIISAHYRESGLGGERTPGVGVSRAAPFRPPRRGRAFFGVVFRRMVIGRSLSRPGGLGLRGGVESGREDVCWSNGFRMKWQFLRQVSGFHELSDN